MDLLSLWLQITKCNPGFNVFTETDRLQAIAQEAVRQASVNLEAIPAPAGNMPVVLGPGWPGILLHEAIGHGLEGDFNRKKTSAFSDRIGEKVAYAAIPLGSYSTHRNFPASKIVKIPDSTSLKLKELMKAVKEADPGQRVWAIFEPRSTTCRRSTSRSSTSRAAG